MIIVNWNTKELLRACLTSVNNSKGTLSIQTIVVDNASSDGSVAMIQSLFPEVQLMQAGGNLGFAKANNLAMPFVKAPLVLFLNPDTVVKESSLKVMVEFIGAHPSIGALGPRILDSNGKAFNLGIQISSSPLTELVNLLFLSDKSVKKIRKFLPYIDPEQSSYVRKLYGACLMVRKEALDQVGYFDDRFFMYCEDVDLCRRITSAGWQLYYLSEAEIIHLAGGASNKSFSSFSILMKCESVSKLMQKYYGYGGKIRYRLALLSGSSIRLLMLTLLKMAYSLKSNRREIEFSRSFRKYTTMVKWSLNLQKPQIKN